MEALKKRDKTFFIARGRFCCVSSSCCLCSFVFVLIGVILLVSNTAIIFSAIFVLLCTMVCFPMCILCTINCCVFFTTPNTKYDEENPPEQTDTSTPELEPELTTFDVFDNKLAAREAVSTTVDEPAGETGEYSFEELDVKLSKTL